MRNLYLTLIVTVLVFSSLPATAQKQSDFPEWAMGPFIKMDKPVLSPTSESVFDCPVEKRSLQWEKQNVYNPAVVVRDGKVYLLYRADDGPKDSGWGRTCRIGLAWSEDGRNFMRLGNPVLFPDEDACKPYEWQGGIEDLHVVEDDAGTYYMNYTAWNGQRDAMLVATSEDLVHWTKHGPAFARLAPERVFGTRSGVVVTRREGDRLIAQRVNSKYLMMVSHSCELAESDNLIDWKPLGKAVWKDGTPGLFDSSSHEAGAIALERPDGILLFYNGGNGGWALGQALVSRQDCTTVLQRLEAPFIKPEYDWERSGFIFNACVANGMVPFKGEWLLYYGAADHQIGLAAFKEEGFVSLFNGKNLDGWFSSDYSVEDGVIICHGHHGGYLEYTNAEYANFILRFEFKLTPGANNGLNFRTDGVVWNEIQILDDTHPKFANIHPYQFHGSLYGVVPAKRGFLKPVGEWNEQEVIVDGNHIIVRLNGTVILDADLSQIDLGKCLDGTAHPGLRRTTGRIGFLGHLNAYEKEGPIYFRNIRIREL